MKVTGFSFIRNAVKYDYPIVEAITSILPICDEFVVALGNSEDNTRELIENINSDKIKIIETVWNDSLREGGKVLAVETNKALAAISKDTDWCFYIQGDEVFHEDGLHAVKQAMTECKDNPKVEGLLVKYHHFYGSYDFVGDSRKWYRQEIRIIKNLPGMSSFRDAQGFRLNDKLIRVKQVNAYMHHYGWVKPPKFQQAKQESFHKMWHDDQWVSKNVAKTESFDYTEIDSLAKFTGTHPKVMQARIDKMNWSFNFDPTQKNFGLKQKFLHSVEKHTGWRIGEYKNFKLLK